MPVKLSLRLRNGAENPIEEAVSDHRRRPEHLLYLFIQAVNARHDHALNVVWDAHRLDLGSGMPPPAACVSRDGPHVNQSANELFKEEGVTLRLANDHLSHSKWQVFDFQEIAGQLFAIGLGEGGKNDLGVALGVVLRRDLSHSSAWCLGVRTSDAADQ